MSLASTLSVGGAANFASTVTITGAASVGGAFNVGGNLLVGTTSETTDLAYSPKLKLSGSGPGLYFEETDTSQDYSIAALGSKFYIRDATAVVPRLTIDSSGKVGIGTTAPARNLTVNGSIQMASGGVIEAGTTELNTYIAGVQGSSGRWAFATNGSERMRITSSGNVGIGTTAPSTKVEISTNSETSILRLTDTATVGAVNRKVGGIEFYQNDTSGGAGIGSSIEAYHVNISGDTDLRFATGDNSERIRIDSSGNVGIGTASPSGILDVEDATVNMSLNSTGTNAGSVLHFQNSGTNRGTVQLGGTGGKSMFFDVVDTAGVMYFRTQSNQTRMTIAAAGGIAMTPKSSGAGQGLSVDASGMANGSNGVLISFASNTGNLISGNAGGAQKFAITHAGALSKTSGSFKIDHPLPSKNATHSLVHSFIEGPQADLIYRGTADLVSGVATVNIDTAAGMTEGTFVVLCTDVQCFTSNEDGWTALKGSVTGNVLTITAQDDSCTDTVSWMVIGERCDPHMLETEWTDAAGKVIVEPLKPEPIEPLEPLELQGGE